MAKLTNEIIQAAISGFEAQKQHIDAQIAELRAMQTSSSNGSVPRQSTTNKRRMSAAGRRAIAEGQRKRWAAERGGAAPKSAKPERKLSPEGRAAIVAALKKRWAEKKAESKPVAKKAARTKAA
jgi:hypothetical protein